MTILVVCSGRSLRLFISSRDAIDLALASNLLPLSADVHNSKYVNDGQYHGPNVDDVRGIVWSIPHPFFEPIVNGDDAQDEGTQAKDNVRPILELLVSLVLVDMSDLSSNDLNSGQDEDGQTELLVGVAKVPVATRLDLTDGKEEADEEEEIGEQLHTSMSREPLEAQSSPASYEDTSWNHDEPCQEHEDHVSDPDGFAVATAATTARTRRGRTRAGRRADGSIVVGQGRDTRRDSRSRTIVGLGEVQCESAVVVVNLEGRARVGTAGSSSGIGCPNVKPVARGG